MAEVDLRPVLVALVDQVDEPEGVGLVRRSVYPEVPVRVEYALTEAGRTLRGPPRAHSSHERNDI